MKAHPAAELFPPMTAGEYAALKADIDTNGLLEPVVTCKKQILDGRHRFRACQELRIKPLFTEYTGDDPARYVISLNLHRRHLSESQRAMIAADLVNMPDHRPADKGANLHTSAAAAGSLLNVSERTVKSAKKVRDHGTPELAAAVRAGKVAVADAAAIADEPAEAQQEALSRVLVGEAKTVKAAVRQSDIARQRASVVAGTAKLPAGVFEVIALDPPWPYDDGGEQSPYDPAGHRASNPYPEMSLEQIGALKLPAADDCVLWLWTTHKFMRHAFPLLDTWGFTDRAILTWVKDRMGLGRWLRSQSEFCIMATRGKPIIDLKDQTTILYGPMREHSRKPDEFYALVDSLCVGRKLDYFSREARHDWAQYGNDVGRFDAVA